MSFISRDPGGRYRRRAEETRRKVIFTLLAIGALCGLSYWWGAESVRSGELAYKQQSIKIRQEMEALEKEMVTLRADAQSAQVRYQQMEERYTQDVPTGGLKQVTDVVRKQLASGVRPERLIGVLQSLRPPKNCTSPVVKRFVAQTPAYKGPAGGVSFGNGAVVISGEGASAVAQDSKDEEAWYDPGKPVIITFTLTGDRKIVKKGLLPIEHSEIVGSKEYRFNVAAGERSFISVTSDTCDAE